MFCRPRVRDASRSATDKLASACAAAIAITAAVNQSNSSTKRTGGKMSFSIEISPGKDAKGAIVHTVIVTIDGHETVLTFQSKDDADSFAQAERARLAENAKNASQRVREIAYRLWQEEGCPEGEALRQWFAAKAIFDSEEAKRDDDGGEVRPHGAETELS
jgi:hypothetical protein